MLMRLKEPVLFINMKAYAEGIGSNALEIAKIAEQISKETGIEIVVVPQTSDIRLIAQNTGVRIFAQHIDDITPGAHTGSTLPEAIVSAGAIGTVLNHAEKRISIEKIESTIKRAKEVGLLVMCCAETLEKAIIIAELSTKPDYIALEPPELIGGDTSVSKARPELISNAAEELQRRKIPLIVGAGIKNAEDTKKALELGAKGAFVASGIVKAVNKEKAIRELVNGFLEV